MKRKIIITTFTGLFYWLFMFVVVKLAVLLNFKYSDGILALFYYIVPFLLGAVVVILNREKRYVGIIYSAMVVVIRYIIIFIELWLSFLKEVNPIEDIFWLFTISGKYSILFALLGGLLAIFINKKSMKIYTKGNANGSN